MCTLSWLINKNGYQIFCNRDELRTREIAQPVKQFVFHDVSVLMPVDPQSEGSWVSTNEFGLSLSLLNFYQGEVLINPVISRGQLLRSLSHLSSLEELDKEFAKEDFLKFAPFRLIAFAQKDDKTQIRGYLWDGEEYSHFTPMSPLTSSAVDFENVSQARNLSYKKHILEEGAHEFKCFHVGHESFSHRGVCMHRDDAETVSFSHIQVNEKKIIFSYQPGAPCKKKESKSLHLERSAKFIEELGI